MTVVTFTSLKGAPGVTTTACLVGATWPAPRRVIVAECDPAGGDLAARFALSSVCGWPTFITAVRRGGADVSVVPHLQQLPGGLDVLVGTRVVGEPGTDRTPSALLASASFVHHRDALHQHALHQDGLDQDGLDQDGLDQHGLDQDGNGDRPLDVSEVAGDKHGTSEVDTVDPLDILADVGRLHPATERPGGWLDRSDVVAVVLGSDAASVLHLQAQAERLRQRCGDRLVLVLIAGGSHSTAEVEGFVGIPVIAELPHDPAAACVASGAVPGSRRLARSRLVSDAHRLAEWLVDHDAPVGGRLPARDDVAGRPILDVVDRPRLEALR